jgi:hypothetical protein
MKGNPKQETEQKFYRSLRQHSLRSDTMALIVFGRMSIPATVLLKQVARPGFKHRLLQ